MQRAIDLRGAVAVNVITMIGIGPLVTIPLVIAALGGPLALIGWIAGAIVALCDGLVWAELSSRYPGSGGTYVYLRAAFGERTAGRALAFLFNWQFLLYAPCLLASGYIGFANYAGYLYPALAVNPLLHDAVAVGIGAVTIGLLYRRTSRVAAFGTVLAWAAVLTLLVVAVAALTHADFSRAFHLGAPVRLTTGLLAGFGSALYITLYDYVGYADAALLGDEVVRPNRTIPMAILVSVVIVAALYVLLQVGVLGVVPWRELLDAHGVPTAQSQYVGSLVVERTWGRVAAIGVTVMVLITAFASLYGNLLGFSRIPFAAARDGEFLPAFARLHPRKDIPHVALLAVGGLSLIAAFFTLDQVIAFLTAGIVLVQSVAQIIALAVVRGRPATSEFRMPLYPLPALVALCGWLFAFAYTGKTAILLGIAWLAAGAIVFLLAARAQRWWPFAACVALGAILTAVPLAARAGAPSPQWSHWNASRIVQDRGYPVFEVDGKPFFVYGAAFFYERMPADGWETALRAYRGMGINTLDLYVIWNWHQPRADRAPDFDGSTDPRRNLMRVLRLAHGLGFKIVLRPGPVIRNEWRNGGYPDWLLEQPPYAMPLRDVLQGRYPATATLQNAHADAAAEEWLGNSVHLTQSRLWLQRVLRAVAPHSGDVIAIALDDDQGAYLDNDTWPAPHWHAYMTWLRDTVRSESGPRVPLFINTYQMKVPAATPAWAWGDWYQSGSTTLGAHELADLDFSTGLLQTQPGEPVMQAEFQAGWLQSAQDAAPAPSDPSNTALALAELLRDGAHGVVNFPVQDTIFPAGWEAPWANWSYAWDAALTVVLHAAGRYAPTAAFGDLIRRYGTLLARTHRVADAAIVWPPTLFSPATVSDRDVRAFADATIAMQRECDQRRLTCDVVDLGYAPDAMLRRYRAIVLPIVPRGGMVPPMKRRLEQLRRDGRLTRNLASLQPRPGAASGTTLLLADDGSYAFEVAVNPSGRTRTIGPATVSIQGGRRFVGRIAIAPRDTRVIPIGLPALPTAVPLQAAATPPPFRDAGARVLQGSGLRVAFAPDAGARIAEFSSQIDHANAATSIGLLRDAVDPAPTPSARDYIAAYTHPLPAGTFNRPYACTQGNVAVTCAYDAPDVPDGGARFSRTLSVTGNALVVEERFEPHDASSARLESISGFAFTDGDRIVRPAGIPCVGFLRQKRFASLCWRQDDVANLTVRATRGAQIVSLVFARRDVRMRLRIDRATDSAQAATLLQANPR